MVTATFLVKNVNLHEAEQQWTDCQSHGGNINGNRDIFFSDRCGQCPLDKHRTEGTSTGWHDGISNGNVGNGSDGGDRGPLVKNVDRRGSEAGSNGPIHHAPLYISWILSPSYVCGVLFYPLQVAKLSCSITGKLVDWNT